MSASLMPAVMVVNNPKGLPIDGRYFFRILELDYAADRWRMRSRNDKGGQEMSTAVDATPPKVFKSDLTLLDDGEEAAQGRMRLIQ